MDTPYGLDFKFSIPLDDNLDYLFQQKMVFDKPEPEPKSKPKSELKPKPKLFKIFENLNLNEK
jgi:hypothetical protein